MRETYLFGERFRPAIDPLDPDPLLILVHPDNPRLTQRHDEPVQRHPSRSVHMHMMFILNVFVVHCVGPYTVGLMSCPKKSDEFVLKLTGVVRYRLPSFGSNEHHLAHMRLRLGMRLHPAASLSIIGA